MVGKLIDVTNFNPQEAVEFIRMRCTNCDIYYFATEQMPKYVMTK
jgi:hypothetical protein